MDKNSEELLCVLNGLQKDVHELRGKNVSFKDIGKKFGITKKQVQEIYNLAKSRKEQFSVISNNNLLDITFTDGELRLIIELLYNERFVSLSKLKKAYKHITEYGVQDYHYDMLVKLINKIESALDINSTQKIIDAIGKSEES